MSISGELHALWDEVRTNRLFKPRYFLTNLYVFNKYSLQLVDPVKVKNTMAPLKVPDCTTCIHNCCHGVENTVSLRLIDIARLLDAGLADMIDLNNRVHIEKEILRKHPGIAANIQSDTWRKFPVLRRVNDICPKLGKDNKCTIYGARPLTCRRYPFMLKDDLKAVTVSTYCKNLVVHAGNWGDENVQELFLSAIDSYNEKVKDLILIYYAKKELEDLKIGKYLSL